MIITPRSIKTKTYNLTAIRGYILNDHLKIFSGAMTEEIDNEIIKMLKAFQNDNNTNTNTN